MGGRRRGQRADAQAAQEPGEQQHRERGRLEEDDRRDDLDQHRHQDHRPAAEGVAEVAGEVEAGHHPDGERGEHRRDRGGREAVDLLVDRVERRRHGREGHHRRERRRHHPEAGAVTQLPGRARRGHGGRGVDDRHASMRPSPTLRVQRKSGTHSSLIAIDCGMDIRALEYFVAVAEELNVTRAAARVHAAQSTVSAVAAQPRARAGRRPLRADHPQHPAHRPSGNGCCPPPGRPSPPSRRRATWPATSRPGCAAGSGSARSAPWT